MQRDHCLNGLEFEQQAGVQQQVRPEAHFDPRAPVIERDRQLTLDPDSAQFKFVGETSLVGTFQQPGSEFAVNRQGGINRRGGERLDFRRNHYLPPILKFCSEPLSLRPFVVHLSACQFRSESSSASSTGRILMPAVVSLAVSSTQFERGVLAATW